MTLNGLWVYYRHVLREILYYTRFFLAFIIVVNVYYGNSWVFPRFIIIFKFYYSCKIFESTVFILNFISSSKLKTSRYIRTAKNWSFFKVKILIKRLICVLFLNFNEWRNFLKEIFNYWVTLFNTYNSSYMNYFHEKFWYKNATSWQLKRLFTISPFQNYLWFIDCIKKNYIHASLYTTFSMKKFYKNWRKR